MASANDFPIREPGDLEVYKWYSPSIKPVDVEVVGFYYYAKKTKMMKHNDLSQIPYYCDNYEILYLNSIEPFAKINLNHGGAIKNDNYKNNKPEEFPERIARNKNNKNIRAEPGSQRYEYINSVIIYLIKNKRQ